MNIEVQTVSFRNAFIFFHSYYTLIKAGDGQNIADSSFWRRRTNVLQRENG